MPQLHPHASAASPLTHRLAPSRYSFAIPLLYVLLAAHMWLAHWVDRWNFLHRLSPPPPTHGRLVVLMTEFFLPLSVRPRLAGTLPTTRPSRHAPLSGAMHPTPPMTLCAQVLLHIIMAPLFFWHICENPEVVGFDADGGNGASGSGGGLAPSDLVNASLTGARAAEQAEQASEWGSGVQGGGGGGGGGDGGGGGGGVSASCSCADRLLEGLSSASLSCSVDADMAARCEVEASGLSQTCGDGAIWQSSAMLILLGSTVVWGALLLWRARSSTDL